MLKQFFRQNLPVRYRRLVYVLIDTGIVLVALGWFYILPRWMEYTRLRNEVSRLEEQAVDEKWSRNPKVLEHYLAQTREWNYGPERGKGGAFRGLRFEERRIRTRATSYLRRKIMENYPAIVNENDWMVIENFIRTSSRIDFKYLANQLEADFAEKKLRLPDKIIQITEARKEPVYQRILQLWVVEFLFRQLEAHQLQIVTAEETGMAEVHLLPPVGFVLNKEDKTPYLWEFPVRITVRGTLQNFFKFQEGLISRKFFFPVRNLSLYTFPPRKLPQKEDVVEINRQTITFTASSFFLPDIAGENSPKVRK